MDVTLRNNLKDSIIGVAEKYGFVTFYNALLGFRFVTLVKGLSTQHDKSHAIRILMYGIE